MMMGILLSMLGLGVVAFAVCLLPATTQLDRRLAIGWGGISTGLVLCGILLAPNWLDSGAVIPWTHLFGFALEFRSTGLSALLSLATLAIGAVSLWVSPPPSRWGVLGVLLLQFALLCVFNAGDLLTLFIGWELTMVPVYFGLVAHGTDRGKQVAIRTFIIMLLGGMGWLVALGLVLLMSSSMVPFSLFIPTGLPPVLEWVVGALLLLAFVIKAPLYPLHTWQADLYDAIPDYLRPLVVGVLSKLAPFAAMMVLPVVAPSLVAAIGRGPAPFLWWGVGLWCVVSACLASVMAVQHRSPMHILAFLSMSHMGVGLAVALLGTSAILPVGLFLVAHTIITAALAWLIQAIPNWRLPESWGGLSATHPHLAWAFLVLILGMIGLPGTIGFVAELGILARLLWSYPLLIGGVALVPVVLNAWAALRLWTRLSWGEPPVASSTGIHPTVGWVVLMMAGLVIVFGIMPSVLQRVVSVALG